MNWYTKAELRRLRECAQFTGAVIGGTVGFVLGVGFVLFLYGVCK